MIDIADVTRVYNEFQAFITELSATWPEESLRDGRENARHCELTEALECLIAAGLEDRESITADEMARFEHLASGMSMSDSPWIEPLRQAQAARRG